MRIKVKGLTNVYNFPFLERVSDKLGRPSTNLAYQTCRAALRFGQRRGMSHRHWSDGHGMSRARPRDQ